MGLLDRLDRLESFVDRRGRPLSIDDLGSGDDLGPLDLIASSDSPRPGGLPPYFLRPPSVRRIVSFHPDPRIRYVLRLRFEAGLTLRDIGDLLGGLSRERARQLIREGLKDLRHRLKTPDGLHSGRHDYLDEEPLELPLEGPPPEDDGE